MNKTTATIAIALLLCPVALSAQKKSIKVKHSDERAKTEEIYYIRSKQDSTKSGTFLFSYNKHIQAQGQFDNGKKSGIWTYSPVAGYTISGEYRDDQMNGRWVYIKNNDTIAVIHYLNDKFNGKQYGYFKNGKRKVEKEYKNGKAEGLAIQYFENGNCKETTEYKEGDIHGTYTCYEPDGTTISSRLKYHHGIPVNLEYSKNGEENGKYSGNLTSSNGMLTEYFLNEKERTRRIRSIRNFKDSLYHGNILIFNASGDTLVIGQFLEGYMSGTWKYYSGKGKPLHTKEYAATNKLLTDSLELATSDYNNPDIFIASMPEFPGGEREFLGFIANNVVYPNTCKEMNIQGKVFVQFIVNRVGGIEQLRIIKSAHPEIDQAAFDCVRKSPYWIPGFHEGLPAKVSFQIPINFTLY